MTAQDAGFVCFNDGAMCYKLLIPDDTELDPAVAISQLKSYPGKELIGDPTVADHDYLSTYGVSDLSGGLGINDHRPGQTDQRYRSGDMDVSSPGKWINPLKTTVWTAPGLTYNLGDLYVGGVMYHYFSSGTDIYQATTSSATPTDTTYNLGSAPVNKGTQFTGTGGVTRLFIPRGASGYSIFTGSAVTNTAASGTTQPAAVDFCVFGTLFLSLDTTGRIWSSIDGSTWALYTGIQVDPWFVGYEIEQYRDLAGELIAMVSTSGGVFTFDPAGPTLYRTEYRYPRHIHHGLAAEVHGTKFLVSTGLDIRDFSGGQDSSIGLNRDDGIGAEGIGAWITDMVSEYNDLYVTVRTTTKHYVFRFDGVGWFQVYTAALAAPRTVPSIDISGAGDDYFVTWCAYNQIFRRRIPLGDRNPRTLLTDYTQLGFEDSSSVLLGMSNKNLPGSDKVATSVAMRAAYVGDEFLDISYPVVSYRLKESDSFTALGNPNQVLAYFGEEAVYPAAGPIPDATYIWWTTDDFSGLHYEEIEWKIAIQDGACIKWFAEYFMKQMSAAFGWNPTFDMRNKVGKFSPEEQQAYLLAMFESGGVQKMDFNGDTFYIGLTSWAGAQPSGKHEDRGTATVTMFQVRDTP